MADVGEWTVRSVLWWCWWPVAKALLYVVGLCGAFFVGYWVRAFRDDPLI